MKIIMYGAEACPDCVSAKARLSSVAEIEVDYRDITKSLRTLKEFLSFRDHDEIFAPVIRAGGIGIPFFILEDQTRTLELSDFLYTDESASVGGSCSAKGKQC